MTVLCPKCRRALRVPPDKEGVPGLKAKCSGCAAVFLVAEAPLALAAASDVWEPPPAGPAARRPGSFEPAVAGVAAPRPAPPSAPGPAPAGSASRSQATRVSRAAANWRRCANHASTPSQGYCSECGKGWCAECIQSQGSAMICPTCDTLCLATAAKEAEEERARTRARPLTAELGTVFRYPFSDAMGFVILAVVVGVFSIATSMAAFGAGIAVLFSQGLLYAYAFNAINKVSAGDLKSFMPSVGDVGDLVEPMRGGVAAFLISTGPLLALSLMHPPAEVLGAMGLSRATTITAEGAPATPPTPQAQPGEPPAAGTAAEPEEEGGEAGAGDPGTGHEVQAAVETPAFEAPRVPAWVFLAFTLALLWKVLYSPVALVAAAISRSFFATLNPLEGVSAIRSMGSTYWSAMGVYTGIAIVETVLVAVLGLIPLAGKFLGAFVQSYTYLAIGCLLGFAVFKKAPELGLD